MPGIVQVMVAAQWELGPGIHQLVLKVPEAAASASPGQFLYLKVGQGYDPLLRRPLSIHDVEGEEISLLYQVRGRGTALLADLKQGNVVDVMGPLGKGFQLIPEGGNALLVGGGMGAVPLYLLARRLAEAGTKVSILLGAASSHQLLRIDAFSRLGEIMVITEDGSSGRSGLVTSLLPDGDFDVVYTCGPEGMMRAVASWATARNLPCQVSLERHMGCGVGACLGCVCRISRSGSDEDYALVCSEGPVFQARQVYWDTCKPAHGVREAVRDA